MNLKTTLALAVLVLAAGGLLWSAGRLPPALDPFPVTATVTDAGTGAVLAALKPTTLTGIEIRRGSDVTNLTRRPGGEWVMAGNWPTRPAEVKRLVDLLTSLSPRFSPEPLAQDADLTRFGLEKPAVVVTLTTAQDRHVLHLGESADVGDRFERPTWLRLDERSEVVRLAPGLLAALDRPADYYLQRRLFPAERAFKETSGSEKVDRLVGQAVTTVSGEQKQFDLVKGPAGWELAFPRRDRLDPRGRDALLEAVPDLWAERFVTATPAETLAGWGWLLGGPTDLVSRATALFWGENQLMASYGLLAPEKALTVTRPDGAVTTLLLGRPSLSAPPKVRSFARLKDFDRVFEVGTEKINSIFVAADTLRDEQVARFGADDLRRVKVVVNEPGGSRTLVLRNETPRRSPPVDPAAPPPPAVWKLEKPGDDGVVSYPADEAAVRDLVTRLSGLVAREKDAAEKLGLGQAVAALSAGPFLGGWLAAPNRVSETLGLDTPAALLELTVEEKERGAEKFTTRQIILKIGGRDRAGKKLYIRDDQWPRIDEVDDGLAELVLDKRGVDYRGKTVLDFAAADVASVDVRASDPLRLNGLLLLAADPTGTQRLLASGLLTADRSGELTLTRDKGVWTLKAGPAEGLSGLDADAGRVNDLVDQLGRLQTTGWVADKATEAQLADEFRLSPAPLTVAVTFADKTKAPKKLLVSPDGKFATVVGSPEVFRLGDDVLKLLARTSLDYRPTQLWLAGTKEDATAFRVHKAGQEPYQLRRKEGGWEVTGPFTVAAPTGVVDRLAEALAAPRCETYQAHAAKDLAPFGLDSPAVKVTLTAKDGKERTLLIGSATPDGAGRYGQVAGSAGVFIVKEDLARAVDQSALDFLDRAVLTFEPGAVTLVRREAGVDVLELEKAEDGWRLTKPALLAGDEKKIQELLGKLAGLQAVRVAAYPAKDLAPFGLDRPTASVLVKTAGDKAGDVTLLLGKVADDKFGDRFGMVQGSGKVVVLPGSVVKALLAGPLAYRDHLIARFPDADSLELVAGTRKAGFGKKDGSWKLTAPAEAEADNDALENFLGGLFRLRADELVAEKPSLDELKKFGLDRPTSQWKVIDGEKPVLDLAVGGEVGGRRYARVAGQDLVFLLDPKLSAAAVAEYRPRAVFKDPIDPAMIESAKFRFADSVFQLTKGPDGMWTVAGQPEVRLNQALVNETFAALRELKLERYVADVKADLGLFGLKPAALVLEVTTPAGKKVLHLGGLEGGSKRRYAHNPAASSGDVFVLDEAVSGRLFRNLPAFQKEGPGS